MAVVTARVCAGARHAWLSLEAWSSRAVPLCARRDPKRRARGIAAEDLQARGCLMPCPPSALRRACACARLTAGMRALSHRGLCEAHAAKRVVENSGLTRLTLPVFGHVRQSCPALRGG